MSLTEQDRFGRRRKPKLRRGSFGEYHQPRLLVASNQRAIEIGSVVLEYSTAVRRDRSRELLTQVLEHKRNALERTLLQPLLDLRSRLIEESVSHSIDPRVDRLESLPDRIEQFEGRDLAFRNKLSQPKPVVSVVF